MANPEVLGNFLQPLTTFLLSNCLVDMVEHCLSHVLSPFDLGAIITRLGIVNNLRIMSESYMAS